MAAGKKYNNKYWENEKPEVAEFGSMFFRSFDEAGKLQIGIVIKAKVTGKSKYIPKLVIDRKELFDSKEGVDFLRGTLDMWEGMLDERK